MIYLLLTMMLPQDSLRTEFGSLAQGWVNNAFKEGWTLDPRDAWVFERTIQEFRLYLDQEFGPAKRTKLFRHIKTPFDLSAALDKVLGKRFGELYFGFYSWSEGRSFWQPGWLETESEHFIYAYHPQSAAQRDIELIKAVAEQAFDDITGILSPDSSALARLSRIVRTENITPRSSGKILVRLHPARKDIVAFEETSGGETSFLPIWHEDTVGYALWIDLSYPGPAALFGIPHETAHSLALVYLCNESALAELLRGGGFVRSDTLRSAVLPSDLLRLEGWAYMVQNNYSAYVRLGLWRSSSEAMAQMAEQYGFPDAYALLNGEVQKTALERTLGVLGLGRFSRPAEMIRYLFSSADMIRFLYERYGAEKLKLFLQDQKDPMDALLQVYDLTPYQFEQAWKNDVLDK